MTAKNRNLIKWALGCLNQPIDHLMQFDELSKLTIIMPTFNRHDYVIRLIVYLSKLKVNLIIVDGSNEAIDSSIMDALTTLPRFSYHHKVISLPERIRFANQFVNTEFVMLMADDDFYLPSGLLSAIALLSSSSSAVACMGQSIGLDVQSSGAGYFFPYGDSLKDYSVQHNEPIERIKKGLRNYRSAASYAVFKANGFTNIWKDIESSSCPEQVEYEHAIRTYLEGDLVTVNETYWVRSFECDPIESAVDGNRANDFNTWFTSAVFAEEKANFTMRLINALSLQLKISDTQAAKLSSEICGYIVSGNHTGLSGKPSSFIQLLLLIKLKLGDTFLSKFWDYLRFTNLGVKLRNYIKFHERKVINNRHLHKKAQASEYLSVLSYIEASKFNKA